MKCGDANPKGNISLFYKGGCKKELKLKDSYRCTGCGGRFHYECILKHFELEEGHDNARNALKKIKDYTKDKFIISLCKKGLQKNKKLII